MRYKCGHKTAEPVILNTDVMSMEAYTDWSKSVGIFGDRTKCWECWCKK